MRIARFSVKPYPCHTADDVLFILWLFIKNNGEYRQQKAIFNTINWAIFKDLMQMIFSIFIIQWSKWNL